MTVIAIQLCTNRKKRTRAFYHLPAPYILRTKQRLLKEIMRFAYRIHFTIKTILLEKSSEKIEIPKVCNKFVVRLKHFDREWGSAILSMVSKLLETDIEREQCKQD